MFKEAKKDMDRIISLEKGKGLQIKEIITEGEPTKEILKVISEEKIELLISLHYEEWRIDHFFFCRPIEKLIHEMPCSIMLVRHDLEPVSG